MMGGVNLKYVASNQHQLKLINKQSKIFENNVKNEKMK